LTINNAHGLNLFRSNFSLYLLFYRISLSLSIMHKSTLLFYSAGIAIGAGIGLAINNLAIGMGLGAALGLIFARNYKRKIQK
jgi:hypothetical protein